MTVNKKRKQVHEETAQKKKKVRSSGSQTVIKTEKRIQAVTEVEDDDWFETKTKVRKKENVKEDECSDQLNLKKKKKKKRKVRFELPKEACSEDFLYVQGHQDLEQESEVKCSKGKVFKKKRKKDRYHASLSLESEQNSDMGLSNHYSDDMQENKFAFAKSGRNNTLNLKLDGEVAKKKKKKDTFSLALGDIQDSEYKQSQKDCRETNVHPSEGRSITGDRHGTDTIHNDGKGCMRRKKRKKKKSDSFLPLAGNQNISTVCYSSIALSGFGESHRKEIRLTDKEEKDATENPESVREMKKKKKKKSKDVSSLKCKDHQCYRQRVLDEHLPTLQEVESEEEELSGRKISKKSKNNNEATKKKKKRKIKKDKETTFEKDRAPKSQKITPLESNKNNKERKMKPAECVTRDTAGDRMLCNSNHMLCDKKRKTVPEDSAEESRSNASIKKKRMKIEDGGDKMLEDVDDVTVVQEKKGNCDEINIDKDTKIGQWSTAAFQSSERGMKFLRLMGGFKKGSAPMEDLSVTTSKSNMALNREGEEKLQQALKMEFDKAMDLKQHRRIGLGFQPAANKKVYIDKYASRSVKFED
uniref:Small acidic protein-like domain-containing protein n=1 Tax=Phasianus colchicus TaxID=9054 RepID=A0A669QKS0_PHACC